MRAALNIIATVLMLLCPAITRADIVVVVNPENPLNSMTREDVADLFLGRYSAFPTGKLAIPVDQPMDSKIRTVFYNDVMGKTVAQANAHWAKLIFSGRATPPRVAPDATTISRMIAENKNVIAYLDKSRITPEMKVVLTIPYKGIKP